MNNTRLKATYRVLAYVVVALITATITLELVNNIGVIEGKISPAAQPMLLVGDVTSFNGGVTFYGESSRWRPECNFVQVNWYLGTRDSRNVPAKVTTGPPKLRENGEFSFGPWVVNIASENVFINKSYSDVVHQCSTFGIQNRWLTVSPFWN